MIEWIIRRSVANRFLVMMGALFLSIWGTWTIINTPVDALPDLSDVQVIIKTSYPGQAPQIVENQVTYPLTTTMLSVPGAKTVRGFSQFGDSYVYVIFEDGTDLYWARSRVLEYLNQVQGKLPAGVSSEIGPDATGVGWIFEYALVDRSGKHDLSELRSLQDWFLKFELKTIPNVAEVASVGGVVKQYQIQVNPVKLSQYGISLPEVKQALESSNQEAGGSSVEMAEAEYMVRASGYLQSIDDFNNIVLKTGENGVPVYLRDVARVQTGPEMRRGIAELNGQGEVAGGVVILRSGKNARDVITAVRDKLETLKASLHWPKTTLLVAALSIFTVIWPLSQVGGEFLPKINEGDLLYMPSTLPGVSPAEAAALLQTTDKLIKSVPEVASVFGKTGKAETATDSAPLEMVETTIQLKPEDQWRPGMTIDKIIEELDRTVRLPGLANLWVPPIRNRIDMLSTGIKSPIGIKVSGTVLSDIDVTAQSIEAVAKTVPGVVSALAERLEGGRYIDVDINREKASR
ncbi:efflux RND transporter permease subunit [Escherichia coli]